jgi:serine/threonine-protein kinase
MGEVFVARRVGAGQFEKKLALKLLLPHLVTSPELVRRFYAEARLAARMHHPNIVEIFDVGEADGRPFIAMQWVEGVSVQQLVRVLREGGERLALPLVRLVATGICEALAYAHALTDGRGRPLELVHRDVTPSNILISSAGQVLLTDFGVARVRDGEGLTRVGQVRGKASYLAPEQLLMTARVDARADLYTAALTLYEVLACDNPFRRPTREATLAAVREGALPQLSSLRPDVPAAMEAALHRALARRPEDRFSDARALREAFVDGPVATAPELAAEVWRLCRADILAANPEEREGPHTHSILSTAPDGGGRPQDLFSALFDEPSTRSLPATSEVSVEGARLEAPEEPDTRSAALTATPTVSDSTRTLDPPGRSPRGLRAVSVALAAGVAALGAAGAWWMISAPPDGALRSEGSLDATNEEALAPGVDAGPPAPATTTAAMDEPPQGDAGERNERDPDGARQVEIEPPAVTRERATSHRIHKSSRPAKSRVEPRLGYLSADAVSWAEVSLGARVLDRTPFARFPLPVGRHVLTFIGPDGQRARRTVVISEGEVVAVRVEFRE